MKKVALVGLGTWGKNHFRELTQLGCEVVVVLHNRDKGIEAWLKENYPHASSTYRRDDVKNDASVTDVFIVTPMETHFDLAREFLLAGKRVFVEKPVTDSATEATQLVALAEERNSQFMVGHIFLYHDCFLKVREELKKQGVTGVSATKTSRSVDKPNASKPLFLDSFIHEVSILLKLFGAPKTTSYQEKDNTLVLEFSEFTASATIVKPQQDEKMRRFDFITKENGYVWHNDELFEKGSDHPICKPSQSALSKELDIFLNRYQEIGRAHV